MTEDEFRILCRRHNLRYGFEQSNDKWIAGVRSMFHLKAHARKLPEGIGTQIFNGVVDEKVDEHERGKFYWRT